MNLSVLERTGDGPAIHRIGPGQALCSEHEVSTEAPFPMEQIRLGLTEHSTNAAAVKRT
jgi:hypothetical protein